VVAVPTLRDQPTDESIEAGNERKPQRPLRRPGGLQWRRSRSSESLGGLCRLILCLIPRGSAEMVYREAEDLHERFGPSFLGVREKRGSRTTTVSASTVSPGTTKRVRQRNSAISAAATRAPAARYPRRILRNRRSRAKCARATERGRRWNRNMETSSTADGSRRSCVEPQRGCGINPESPAPRARGHPSGGSPSRRTGR